MASKTDLTNLQNEKLAPASNITANELKEVTQALINQVISDTERTKLGNISENAGSSDPGNLMESFGSGAYNQWIYPLALEYQVGDDSFILSTGVRGTSQYLYRKNKFSGYTEEKALYNGYVQDDHNAAAIYLTDSGRLVCGMTGHNDSATIEVDSFGGVDPWDNVGIVSNQIDFSGIIASGSISYVQFAQLHERLFVFTRVNQGIWAFAYSADEGQTWSSPQRLFTSASHYYMLAREFSRNSDYENGVATTNPEIRIIAYDHPIIQDLNELRRFTIEWNGSAYVINHPGGIIDIDSMGGDSGLDYSNFQRVYNAPAGKRLRLWDLAYSEDWTVLISTFPEDSPYTPADYRILRINGTDDSTEYILNGECEIDLGYNTYFAGAYFAYYDGDQGKATKNDVFDFVYATNKSSGEYSLLDASYSISQQKEKFEVVNVANTGVTRPVHVQSSTPGLFVLNNFSNYTDYFTFTGITYLYISAKMASKDTLRAELKKIINQNISGGGTDESSFLIDSLNLFSGANIADPNQVNKTGLYVIGGNYQNTPSQIGTISGADAIEVNGVDQYVDADIKSFAQQMPQFTFEARIATTDTSERSVIAGTIDDSSTEALFKVTLNTDDENVFSAGKVGFQVRPDSSTINEQRLFCTVKSVKDILFDGFSHTLSITFDNINEEYHLYIDGVEYAIQNSNPDYNGAMNDWQTDFQYNMFLGAYNIRGTAGYFFNGKIDQIRFWNDLRTLTEITNNLTAELVGNEPGLSHYFTFSEGSGSVTEDAVTTTNHNIIGNVGDNVWSTIPGNIGVLFHIESDSAAGGNSAQIFFLQETDSNGLNNAIFYRTRINGSWGSWGLILNTNSGGASGSFTAQSGEIVTVQDGLITSIT